MFDSCEACPKPLALPLSSLMVCTHCDRTMCKSCLIEHNKQLTMTFKNVPELMRGKR